MYSKFGDVSRAHYLFDKMPERKEASWNTMMSGFVRAGSYQQSVNFFREMLNSSVKPSGFLIASLITACDRSSSMVFEGIQVHGFSVKSGFLCDVYVGTSLLHFYGAYGILQDALKLFAEMPERNVVSWTSLMVSCSNNGEPEAVMDLYRHMRNAETSCNQNTFATVIAASATLEDELLGRQVFGHIVKSGFETDVSVANSLISMFGSLGNLEDACHVFDHMDERDTISWNSIISANVHNSRFKESLQHFDRMRCSHNQLNSTTLSSLLTVCGSVDNLKWGRGIHGIATRLGLDSNVIVSNTLLAMYAQGGSIEDSEFVFREMLERDSISWNSMIAGYVQCGRSRDALEIFTEMLRKRNSINYVTFTSALAACSNPECLAEGKIIHALVILMGINENLILGNALVSMYAKSGVMITAKRVFNLLPKRDEVTWNALIGGYAESKDLDEAVNAFQLMRKEGIPADYITFANVLGACSTPDDLLNHGKPIHSRIVSTGFESNKFVHNSLIIMYAKCGDLYSSSSIFEELEHKNSASWNAIISAHAHHDCGEEIFKLITRMKRNDIDLDQFSFSEGLAAAAKLALLEEGKQLHGIAVKLGFESDPFVTNSAMDMYGKCGEMEDVLKIAPEPVLRSRLSWNILISAFARHGQFHKAGETFHQMLKSGVKPDRVTFISLLSACSHGGLVDEGLAHYTSMTKEFGIPAGVEHCVCVIDLLGRSGRFAEAENFIDTMPFPPNALVWRSLLSSCKIHGNLELGQKAARSLIQLDPSDDSAYVLYSNVCATTGRWDNAEDIRRQMGSQKVKKQPACSWVKLKNEVSSFGMGDQSHPQSAEINAKLGELKRMIREAGYVPDTSYALQDTDEEQKEQNLWGHSERLALAFGLINTPGGSTVRVFKNLRVCGDCHSFYKFVSGIVGRRIVLRDPYRFHHFSGGECSCADYW